MAKNNIKIKKVKKIVKNHEDLVELISTRDRIMLSILMKTITNRN